MAELQTNSMTSKPSARSAFSADEIGQFKAAVSCVGDADVQIFALFGLRHIFLATADLQQVLLRRDFQFIERNPATAALRDTDLR